jgi:hypothetical protein
LGEATLPLLSSQPLPLGAVAGNCLQKSACKTKRDWFLHFLSVFMNSMSLLQASLQQQQISCSSEFQIWISEFPKLAEPKSFWPLRILENGNSLLQENLLQQELQATAGNLD